jgi:vitamin B12 transporter
MIKKYPLTTVFLLSALLAAQPALSADNLSEEEQLMFMYFSEDALVETATRSPKPINQVAEDVTVITAEEIEAMRAHGLDEVLSRQAGVFITFFGQDFLGDSAQRLLGTRQHHVLLLVDGVRLNLNSSGYALINFIPLDIVKRIEIIKGAASSTWGSALGGVINIITKDVGKSSTPSGDVNLSYGEGHSRDLSADVAGKVGELGYYLHGGNIDSDGLRLDRYSERDSVYAKTQLQLPYNSSLTLTGGYSDPLWKNLNWSDAWGIPDLNLYEDVRSRNSWATVYLDTTLTKNLSLHLSGQHFDNDYTSDKLSLGGSGGPSGDLVYRENWQDTTNGFTSHLTWTAESVTANLGFESNRSKLIYGNLLGVLWGGPTASKDDPVNETRRGVYANVTYVKGKFAFTPGLRYDYNSQSDASVNPSLGLTCMLSSDTLLRTSIAKGFSAPYLSASLIFPDLEPENTWTYQFGMETSRIPLLQLKGTVFHQKVEDAWHVSDTASASWNNAGFIRLNGLELEAKTAVYHGLSFSGNFTYVVEDSMGDGSSKRENDETYTTNLIFSYHCSDYGLRAEVAGHYYWMNEEIKNEEPDFDDFLWDVLIGKDFVVASTSGEVYLKAHNILNGNQYWDYEYPNPERWVEAGIAFKF